MSNKDILIFAEKLGNIGEYAQSQLKPILEIHEKDVLEEQKERIHVKGEDVFNKKFGDYSPFSIEKRKEEGKFYDFIILKDEGDFEESEFIKSSESGYEFGATDPKTAKLKIDYDPMFGADEAEKGRLSKIVHFSIMKKVRKYLASWKK